jgi:hypothetical protein
VLGHGRLCSFAFRFQKFQVKSPIPLVRELIQQTHRLPSRDPRGIETLAPFGPARLAKSARIGAKFAKLFLSDSQSKVGLAAG